MYGYACFYKADAPSNDLIKAQDMTISFVCEKKPEKLLKYLQEEWKLDIIKILKGIYYIHGAYFPIQLILTSELSSDDNFWLRNLTSRLKGKSEAEKLLAEYGKHKNDGLYKAVMNVIVRANDRVFEEAKKMCDALLELMKDELDAKKMEGKIEGEAMAYLKLYKEGILSISDVASRLHVSEEQVKDMLQN